MSSPFFHQLSLSLIFGFSRLQIKSTICLLTLFIKLEIGKMAATKVNLKSAGDLTMLIFPYKSLEDHMLIDFF